MYICVILMRSPHWRQVLDLAVGSIYSYTGPFICMARTRILLFISPFVLTPHHSFEFVQPFLVHIPWFDHTNTPVSVFPSSRMSSCALHPHPGPLHERTPVVLSHRPGASARSTSKDRQFRWIYRYRDQPRMTAKDISE